MKLTEHSLNRIRNSAHQNKLCREYYEPLERYLVYGLEPGGFWTAVLANDCMGALARSHPANSIPDLKNAVNWIVYSWPSNSWGSYEAVKEWLSLTEEQRRRVLENRGLIFSEKTEVELALRGPAEPVAEFY
jgi:hypothetical protein